MRFIACCAFLVGLPLAAAFCQTPASPETDPCANPNTTPEQLACAAQQYKLADDELNRIYMKVSASLEDPETKALFLKVQKGWLRYRDAYAEFEADLYRGGTLAGQVRLQCLTEMTIARTAELRRTYEDDIDH